MLTVSPVENQVFFFEIDPDSVILVEDDKIAVGKVLAADSHIYDVLAVTLAVINQIMAYDLKNRGINKYLNPVGLVREFQFRINSRT